MLKVRLQRSVLHDILLRPKRLRRQFHIVYLSHIDDYKKWIICEPLEIFMDLDIGRADAWSRAVPTQDLLLGVDFLEHVEHLLQVVMIQKPNFRIAGFLFKWYGEAVGDFELSARGFSENNSYNSLSGVSGYTVVVVYD